MIGASNETAHSAGSLMVSEALELEREEAVSALFGIRKSSSQNQLASLLNQEQFGAIGHPHHGNPHQSNENQSNASITPDSVLSDSFGKAPPSLNISGAR